ncbi:hypothetical protein LEN26_012477 [Aphanomyces euteiches]|nr:hypothetical protein LEN26_012477 [Aphanomyces euteiches]KAH9127775.1 hypothetical protein AeMF1_001968 [Aphanomyces euteiches]KAH9190302.1 hypothetical protein AeNC1_007717 [Aphanomyces euteiches]
MSLPSLTDFAVTGILFLSLYSIIGVSIAYRLYLHIRHKSSRPRIIFHIVLLQVILFRLPKAVQFVWFPDAEVWVFAFVSTLFATLLLLMTFSYVGVEWAEVAQSGRVTESRFTVRRIVIWSNVVVFLWAIVACTCIAKFDDTPAGYFAYTKSGELTSLVVVGSVAATAATILLIVQGLKIRKRLLQSEPYLDENDVHRSMVRLVLSICIIVFTTWIRLFFNLMAVLGVDAFASMSMVPFHVWSDLVPTVFPVICLLYLQRRLTTTAKITRPNRADSHTTTSKTMERSYQESHFTGNNSPPV